MNFEFMVIIYVKSIINRSWRCLTFNLLLYIDFKIIVLCNHLWNLSSFRAWCELVIPTRFWIGFDIQVIYIGEFDMDYLLTYPRLSFTLTIFITSFIFALNIFLKDKFTFYIKFVFSKVDITFCIGFVFFKKIGHFFFFTLNSSFEKMNHTRNLKIL